MPELSMLCCMLWVIRAVVGDMVSDQFQEDRLTGISSWDNFRKSFESKAILHASLSGYNKWC